LKKCRKKTLIIYRFTQNQYDFVNLKLVNLPKNHEKFYIFPTANNK